MSTILLTESKLRNIIKEAVKTVLNENNGLVKYNVYYCEDGGNVFTNGHYQTSYNVKSDKDALKMFLNEFSKIYLANLDDDLDKTETYSICKVTNNEEGEDIDEVWNIEFYTKNGKKVEYKYHYLGNGNFEVGDSYQERNKKRFFGYISDYIGRKIQDIPEGYCTNMTLIQKYVKNFVMKKAQGNNRYSCYIQVCDKKTDKWKCYFATVFDYGDELEFSMREDK